MAEKNQVPVPPEDLTGEELHGWIEKNIDPDSLDSEDVAEGYGGQEEE